MSLFNRSLALCASLVIVTAALSAKAATTITGNNNGNPGGDGFDTTSGAYIVPADSGPTPSAKFNSNGNDGLFVAAGTATSITVSGGQFDSNGVAGIEVEDFGGAALLTINGGEFKSGFGVLYDGPGLTINGGTFFNGEDIVYDGPTTITGGIFGSGSNFVNQGSLTPADVYGTFVGLTPGTTETLSGAGTFFTGTLENDTIAQTFHSSGPITLHDLPEPASLSLLGLASLSLLRRRVA